VPGFKDRSEEFTVIPRSLQARKAAVGSEQLAAANASSTSIRASGDHLAANGFPDSAPDREVVCHQNRPGGKLMVNDAGRSEPFARSQTHCAGIYAVPESRAQGGNSIPRGLRRRVR